MFEVAIIGSGDGAVRVVVSGELDIATSPRLDAAVERVLAEADDVVIDLSNVGFIDSSGLYVIAAAARGSEADGKRLRISASLSPQVERLFELAGMTAALPLVHE
jgi:anti-sigma B factor antagonist